MRKFESFSLLALLILGDGLVEAARNCYSCSGIDCSRPTKLNVKVECSSDADQCVSTFHPMGGTVFRGCLRSLPESEKSKCDATDGKLCSKCTGELCNNVGPIDAKCITCHSSDNSDCLQSPGSLDATLCPISTTPNYFCYVEYFLTGETMRGCATNSKVQQQCRNNPDICHMCSPVEEGSDCNGVLHPPNRAICSSCAGDTCTTSIGREICEVADDDCVALLIDGTQKKKCAGSLTTSEQDYCNNNLKNCLKCNGNECNVLDVPNNGGQITNRESLMVILAISIWPLVLKFLKF